MAEPSASSELDPSSAMPAGETELGSAPEVLDATGAEASEVPVDLEAVLAAALDEDDLPDPHPPVPTPTLEAATARPTVGSYGAPDAEVFGAATGQPTVATTLEVVGIAGQGDGNGAQDGGEFDVLLGKVKAWFAESDLPGQWDRLSGPLRGVGLLLGGLLVVKLYLALLDTLDDLPLLPRLLQLVGLIYLFNFSLTRLTRSSERKVILEDWKRRWDAFRGS